MPNHIPTLMQYLRAKHKDAVAKLATASQAGSKKKFKPLPELSSLLTISGFVAFCEKQLLENPAVTTFIAAEGQGLVLADNTKVLVSSSGAAVGDMQQTTTIAITPEI